MHKENHEKQIIPNLNALRFISALFVFLIHYFNYINYKQTYDQPIIRFIYQNIISKGSLGVNFFFVLSGFLITHLLIKERELTGTISLKSFYYKRILRIWPVYFFVFFIAFIFYPLFSNNFSLQVFLEHAPWYIGFIGNLDRAYTAFSGMGCDLAGIMWSISVEEQFYIFWPAIFILLPLKRLPILLIICIAGSLLFRLTYFSNEHLLYFHTFSVMNDILVGCLGAALLKLIPTIKKHITNASNHSIILLYLSFTIYVVFQKEICNAFNVIDVLNRLIISIFFILIIFHQSYSLKGFKAGKIPYFENLGIISYGFYAYHLISIMFLQKLLIVLKIDYSYLWAYFYPGMALCLGISLTISKLSFKYLESPFLRLKDEYIKRIYLEGSGS
jgi:peptidoglycan/LPS O-acetylase OafA/YrhL